MCFDSPLTRDEETELLGRLLANDPTAPSDLASRFLDALVDLVLRANRGVDEPICVQAAEDAILALGKNPGAFRCGESLWAYLRMSAQGDVKNALASERRRRKRNVPIDSVEQGLSGGKYKSTEREPAFILIGAEDTDTLEKRILPCARRGLTDDECKALDLMIDGEKRTGAFAAVLGIGDRPAYEQRTIVKRVKDKLKIRLKRCREDT